MPLLSICIPTYNRAEYLEQCLESIIHQDGFDEIEVIISDNCSSDRTEQVGRKYEEQYYNIKYFRNDKNIIDMNYPLAFKRGNGTLRKLTNDTTIYKPGAIRYMLNAVRENNLEKPQIYFLNSKEQGALPIVYKDLEHYVSDIGYLLTWIGAIAIWEDDCDDLSTLIENTDSRIGQVPFLLENFEKHNGAVVYPQSIMSGVLPSNKDLTYGLYQVFYINFMGYIKDYVHQNKISMNCYERVRKVLLMNFFSQWILNWERHQKKFKFSESENLRVLVENEYKNDDYYKEYKYLMMKKRITGIWSFLKRSLMKR